MLRVPDLGCWAVHNTTLTTGIDDHRGRRSQITQFNGYKALYYLKTNTKLYDTISANSVDVLDCPHNPEARIESPTMPLDKEPILYFYLDTKTRPNAIPPQQYPASRHQLGQCFADVAQPTNVGPTLNQCYVLHAWSARPITNRCVLNNYPTLIVELQPPPKTPITIIQERIRYELQRLYANSRDRSEQKSI